MFATSSFKSLALQSGKALAGFAALLMITTGTVGCNSEDAAVIGGTIAIVAGVIAIDGATDHHPRCEAGYREVCRSIRDRFGRMQTSCSREWDSCARRLASGFTPEAGSPLALSSSGTKANDIAFKYNLPLQSAERLTAILQDAAAGNSSALVDMGLSNDEMTRVARYTMPTDAALDQIAAKLAMTREMSRGLVQQLMNETRAQMADISSPAWTACQATGKWKTDANGGTCKSTSWSGCAPETGASICASVN
ncbi:hypothetical protein BH10BDE1_BH10BDE1_11480 [soil metagenome]